MFYYTLVQIQYDIYNFIFYTINYVYRNAHITSTAMRKVFFMGLTHGFFYTKKVSALLIPLKIFYSYFILISLISFNFKANNFSDKSTGTT